MRPPVLPSASMTLLLAVAGVAIYWITAAVAALRLQHSYSKFAADARSSDHTPRPQDSAGHDATGAVTSRAAAAVTENVPSVASDGHTRRTVRPSRQYVVSNSGVVRSRQTTTFSFLAPPGDPDGSCTCWRGAERNEGSSQPVPCRCTRCGDSHRCDRREHRREANVATTGHVDPPRPLECAGGDPADAPHTKHFTSSSHGFDRP